nr:retrovirus-related Pol polyprotein from transposon TNT 1-94 [Tanacetum cinerariifolium]
MNRSTDHDLFKFNEYNLSLRIVKGLDQTDHPNQVCEGFLFGKHARSSFSKEATSRAKKPLQLIHIDLCGPITPSSYGLKIKSMRLDRGGEFLLKEFNKFCEDNGIRRFLTAPYSPQQNRVVKRKNRTILNMVRSMLKTKKMPKEFWAQAVDCVDWSIQESERYDFRPMTDEEETGELSEEARQPQSPTPTKTHLQVQVKENQRQEVCRSSTRQVMEMEIKTIEKNDTWELTTLLKGQKAIGVKWVYKDKKNAKGEVEKYKARIMAKERNACVDLTGVSPLMGLSSQSFTVGQTALKAASCKVTKHEKACIENQHVFVPLAFDTFVFLAPKAVELLNRFQRLELQLLNMRTSDFNSAMSRFLERADMFGEISYEFARIYPIDQKDMVPALRPVDFRVPIPSKVKIDRSPRDYTPP